MKVIIAGGRDFNDYGLLVRKCNNILRIARKRAGVTIVSGCSRGADTIGEQYAEANKFKIKRFPYLKQYGKAGGPMRNEQMAKYADCLIAFWDGSSTGTADMIERAKDHGLQVRIIKY